MSRDAPFPFHVVIAGHLKPRAGFATLEDARGYAQWASGKRPGQAIQVTDHLGRPLYTFRGGVLMTEHY